MNRILSLQKELGTPSPRAKGKVIDTMNESVQQFIANSPFMVLSTSNLAGDCDASPKGGKPGWVKVLDEKTLLIPDVGGNRLFQSYENMSQNPKAGLVFIMPGQDVTVRVNGRVEFLEREELKNRGCKPEVNNSDSNSNLIQGILLIVDEAYYHCPRSFYFAELWNSEKIESNRTLDFKRKSKPKTSTSSLTVPSFNKNLEK